MQVDTEFTMNIFTRPCIEESKKFSADYVRSRLEKGRGQCREIRYASSTATTGEAT
jgi:hypothetical protein